MTGLHLWWIRNTAGSMYWYRQEWVGGAYMHKLFSTRNSCDEIGVCSRWILITVFGINQTFTSNAFLRRNPLRSNLGSRTPRIMNSSVYKQIFRTQGVSGDVLCLELRTRKQSTSWSDKLGVSASAVFVEEWSSGKNSESATPKGASSVAV